MAKKRSRSTAAARNRIRPAHRWGMYLVPAMLLLLGVTVAAAQMLWASATPEPAAAPAVSNTSPAANGEVVSNAPGGDNSAQTLNLYGGGMRPLVEERDGVQTLNIYGPGGQIIAQVVRDGQGAETVRYLLTDHLGSTRVVLDAEGNAVARYEYAPHGETTAAGTAAGEVRYRYTGHPYDEGQEVYETPNRGYDPTLGRFLSVDPQRQDASPYVYAGNNPVGYVDPTGGIIEVPFFVVSGMPLNAANQGGPLSRSIARGFGLKSDQIVYPSSIFNSTTDSIGRERPSPVQVNPTKYLRGGGRKYEGTEWSLNKKLYWFIGTDKPVTDPNRLALGLQRLRGARLGFADEIVVIDFSGDANKIGLIMGRLSGRDKPARLVTAGLDVVEGPKTRYRPTRIARKITRERVEYTPSEFGKLVNTTTLSDEVPQLSVAAAQITQSPVTTTSSSEAIAGPSGMTAGQKHSLEPSGGSLESVLKRQMMSGPTLEEYLAPQDIPAEYSGQRGMLTLPIEPID